MGSGNNNMTYATPPRSDGGDDNMEKDNTKPSLEASSETQAPVFNPMFVTNDEPEPSPSDIDSTPSYNMQLINAGEKRAMALDNIETVMTDEQDESAARILEATTFETYWTRGKTKGYVRSNYLKELDEGVNAAAEEWRISNADSRDAQVAHMAARINPTSFIKGRNPKQMAKMEMETRREIREAEKDNYQAHLDKANRLLVERRVEDAEAKKEAVGRQQEARRAKQVERDRKLAQNSRNRVGKSRAPKKRGGLFS